MNITRDFKNDLLKRREVSFTIASESNPGFENSKKMVVEKFKVDDENVVIKNVKSRFGVREFYVDAFVYNSKEDKEMVEPRAKVKAEAAK